jgi:hypothetical protein
MDTIKIVVMLAALPGILILIGYALLQTQFRLRGDVT